MTHNKTLISGCFDLFDVRQQTALHEAAHAVAYDEFGLDFEYIDIEPSSDGLYAGQVSVPPRQILKSTKEVVSCAGPIVEAIMAIELGIAETDDPLYEVELMCMSRIFLGSLEGDWLDYSPESAKEAAEIIFRRWRDVESIALAALARTDGRLCYADAMKAIRERKPARKNVKKGKK